MRNTRLIVSTILAISAATVVGGCMNYVPDPATTETKPETVIETSEMPETTTEETAVPQETTEEATTVAAEITEETTTEAEPEAVQEKTSAENAANIGLDIEALVSEIIKMLNTQILIAMNIESIPVTIQQTHGDSMTVAYRVNLIG